MEEDEDVEIAGLDKFNEEPTMRAKDLLVKYVTYTKDDPRLHAFNRSWIDYNTYGMYVKSAAKPTYYAFVSNLTVKNNELHEVVFRPTKITQEYTVKFILNKEAGVQVDTIIGILSGIPERYGLTTRFIDVNTTNKMAFAFEVEGKENGFDNNAAEETMSFTSKVNAIGLLHSKISSYRQGPGILQLCIYTKVRVDETKDWKTEGNVKSKTIYAVINLYNEITEVQPLIADVNGNVTQNGLEVVLDIDETLTIDREQVVENANEDNSLDHWKNADKKISVDI